MKDFGEFAALVATVLVIVACCSGVSVNGEQVFGCSCDRGLEFKVPP